MEAENATCSLICGHCTVSCNLPLVRAVVYGLLMFSLMDLWLLFRVTPQHSCLGLELTMLLG